jgi:predicted amidohydrolase YtcJ
MYRNFPAAATAGGPRDLTILSADIMKIPEPEILKTTCAMTVIGGEIVYEPGK